MLARAALRCGIALMLIGPLGMTWGSRPLPAIAQTPPSSRTPEDKSTFDAERRGALDTLFAALSKAGDDEAARDIVQQIWQLWSQSGRGDVDVLMLQAGSAMGQRQYGMASILLDEVVELAPDFAEGWNRRATLRWMMDDHAGSQADIDKVLALEPRHFGALTGRAMMLVEAERFREALMVYRRALAVNPFLAERHQIIPMLEKKIETKL